MPHTGLPRCYHTEEIHKIVQAKYPNRFPVEESRCPEQFWLIRKNKPRSDWIAPNRLIECRYCGKQRWTTTQRIYGELELKPKGHNALLLDK